ncbi:hypothetical protein HDV06_004349 [Boothiomyces sp. JEL0866]|nr:hypothetical protein HDV06_004349 [Boothiomyces sp. JEL0866]
MKYCALATFIALVDAEPRFKRFFQIIFENTDASVALEQPYMKSLLPKGRYYSNMHAIAHPSQPNYIAMIAGDVLGVKDDFNVDLTQRSLADTLEDAGKTWTSYQESYPGGVGNCVTDAELMNKTLHIYERKHNPFMSFKQIHGSKRCDNIKNADWLDKDIAAGKVADYVLYAPNQIHDGHSADYGLLQNKTLQYSFARINVGDQWLSNFLPKYLNNPFFKDTLFLITFDENDVIAKLDTTNNLIYTLAIGAGVEPNTSDNANYSHYSQLALIQKEWGLKPLGRNDLTAAPFALSDKETPTTSTSITPSNAPTTASASFKLGLPWFSILLIPLVI